MAMSFRQQKDASQNENFTLTRLIFIAALLVVATTLHGCGEGCPKDGVPFSEPQGQDVVGWVFFTCKGDACTSDKIKCATGFGYGFEKAEDGSMEFQIDKQNQCVMKFTKPPVACHLCYSPNSLRGVKCEGTGESVMVTEFADGKRPIAEAAQDDLLGDIAKLAESIEAPSKEDDKSGDDATPGVGNAATADDPEAKQPGTGSEATTETPQDTKVDATDPKDQTAGTSSLADIGDHNEGSNSVQIAPAEVDAKATVSVSSLDFDVHHDVSKPVPEAASLRPVGTPENGLDHTINSTRATAQEPPQLKTRWHKSRTGVVH